MENIILKSEAETITFSWTKTIEFLQQKLINNEKLIFEEEEILNSYKALKNMIEQLHTNKGRLLKLPILENI